MGTEFDELEQRTRPTDPAPPMSDHEMLVSLMEQVSFIAGAVRRIEANQGLDREQAHAIRSRVSELEDQVEKIQNRTRNGSEQPGEAP